MSYNDCCWPAHCVLGASPRVRASAGCGALAGDRVRPRQASPVSQAAPSDRRMGRRGFALGQKIAVRFMGKVRYFSNAWRGPLCGGGLQEGGGSWLLHRRAAEATGGSAAAAPGRQEHQHGRRGHEHLHRASRGRACPFQWINSVAGSGEAATAVIGDRLWRRALATSCLPTMGCAGRASKNAPPSLRVYVMRRRKGLRGTTFPLRHARGMESKGRLFGRAPARILKKLTPKKEKGNTQKGNFCKGPAKNP